MCNFQCDRNNNSDIDLSPLRQMSRSRLFRPPGHFLHSGSARQRTMPQTLGARLPFSRLTKGSAPALLIVPFIIDDGSLITFTWRPSPLIRRIVTEVLSKRAPPPQPPPAPNYPCIFNGFAAWMEDNGWGHPVGLQKLREVLIVSRSVHIDGAWQQKIRGNDSGWNSEITSCWPSKSSGLVLHGGWRWAEGRRPERHGSKCVFCQLDRTWCLFEFPLPP